MVITSINAQRKNPNRFNIFIDGQYSFSAASDDLIEFGIREGILLDQRQADELIRRCTYKDAFERACRFLQARGRSEHEIRSKLQSLGFDDPAISDVVDRLIQMRLIDDSDFARMWIEERNLLKPSSRRVLINELREKGIDKRIILNAIDKYAPDDIEIAVEIAKKKLSQIPPDTEMNSLRQRIYKYLSYKGFDYETSKRAVIRCLSEDDGEVL